ncbi:MAG: allantoinase AllB [Myxococcota bacterium]
MSLRLYSRRVLGPTGLGPGGVIVRDGVIAAVEPGPPQGDVIDVGNLVLMPGLVDTHVHVNEPGRTEWEGYESATRAAALGGVTTLADMPLNSSPVTTSLESFHAKLQAARGKLYVDVGFWGGVIPGNADQIHGMVSAGVRGFKCFLCPSGIDEFPPVEARDLLEAMPLLRVAKVPLLVHAELELPLRDAAQGDAAEYATYLHSRPPEWEDAAVALIVDLVRQTGCRAHIVHLSSAGALATLRRAKAEGLPVSAETCPHYLCLSAEEVPRGATSFKCAPPIRGRANQDQLWAALAEGVIDFVVTDHSPCLPSLKLPEEGDFLRAWGGISSLQLGLAAVWTEASRRGHSLLDVQRWLGPGPAALLGVHRGPLVVGAAAGLIAFDDSAPFVVDPSTLAHKNPISAYAGRSLRGLVRHVWLRGTPIVENGVITGPPGGEPLLA